LSVPIPASTNAEIRPASILGSEVLMIALSRFCMNIALATISAMVVPRAGLESTAIDRTDSATGKLRNTSTRPGPNDL